MQTLRIFISSPGDVAGERQVAGKVIERLQGKYWSFVRLDDIFWEQKVIRSTAHYQDELVNPGECEMVIGILWSRLGSLMPDKFRKASGARYDSGTEWELEMAFEAYEQSLARTGDPVAAKPDIVIYRRNQPRPRFEDPAQEALASEQITKLDAYFRDNFWFPDGTIKRPVTNYQTLAEFEEKLLRNLEELILRQIPGLKPGYEPPPISGSPFKGLQSFDFSDSDRYFGRNREIREIQQRLVASAGKGLPFVLIYGGSGYGKSSLMRAGLAPVLTRPGGSLDDIQGWRRVPFQPAKGTGSLCERLARALIQAPTREESEHSRHHRHWPLTGLAELVDSRADTQGWDSARLTRHFSHDDQRVFAIAAVAETLESLNRHLLLEIDQLEEMFTTPGIDANQRAAFLRTVGDLCLSGRIWVVATMRSEFFPRVAEQPELFALVGKERGYILPPPDRQSLREIIRYPVLAARLDFERRMAEIEIAGETAKFEYLDDQILSDAESSPDALPLLEFTLQQLYEEKRGTLLTWEAYAAAGGLKGAIAKRAREVYDGLDSVAREARHRIFAALVHVDAERNTVTRQRASLEELNRGPGAEDFLQAFLGNHLLITDEDALTAKAIVTLAHEALITHWDELATWINDHRGDLLARQRLHEQTGLWQQNGRKKTYLLSEARLAEAERVAERNLFTLASAENDFLNLSRQRSRKKLRTLQIALVVFALVAVTAGILGVMAKEQTKRAELGEYNAEEQRGLAEKEAERALALNREAARSNHVLAEEKWSQGDQRRALAHYARAVRYDPEAADIAQAAAGALLDAGIAHPIMNLIGHSNGITSIAVSPDGQRILTASRDHTARIWDASSGREITRFVGHSDFLLIAAFSRDGKSAVTSSVDKTVRIWDVESGQEKVCLSDHTGSIGALALSPDGQRIVTGSQDKTARVWDVATGRLITYLEGHSEGISEVSFSPDGIHILTLSEDKTARLWDASTGKQLLLLEKDSNWTFRGQFSPDGKRVLTCGEDNMVRLLDLETGNRLVEFVGHTDTVGYAAFSPDGRRLITGSTDSTARIWDSDSGKELVVLKGHSSWVSIASFSPDGQRVLTASHDHTARIWDPFTGNELARLDRHKDVIRSAVFTPDGRRIVTGSWDTTARIWEVTEDKVHSTLVHHTDKVSSIAFSLDGERAITGSDDQTAAIWDVEKGKLLQVLEGHEAEVFVVALSPDGQHACTGSRDCTARLWDIASGQELVRFEGHNNSVTQVSFSPDGKSVITGSYDKTVRIWELDSGKETKRFEGHSDFINALAISRDGTRLITGSDDKTARVWEFTTGREIARMKGHSGSISAVAFSPDGTQVLTASNDNTARLWNTATGREVARMEGHEGGITSVCYSPDSSQVLTGSLDNTARIWDGSSGKELVKLVGHKGWINAVAFSPDGFRVVTGSQDDFTGAPDTSVRLWDVRTGKELARMERHKEAVQAVAFSPDGRRILTASRDGTSYLWPLPPNLPAPAWFSDLLTLRSGQRIDSNGRFEDLSVEEMHALGEHLRSNANDSSDYGKILNWALLARSERPCEPYGNQRYADRAADILKRETTLASCYQAYALDPESPLVHLALAEFEVDSVSADLLRNISLARLPDDTEIQRRAASLLEYQGELVAALGCLERALLKSQEDQPTLERHINILWKLGRKNEAISMVRAALENNANNTTLLTQAALFLSENGQGEETRDLIQKALAIEPASALVWRRAGWCFAYLDDWSGAKDAFARAKSFAHPVTVSILGGLSISQWQTGDQEAAVKTFQELVNIEPNVIQKEYIQGLPWSRMQRDVLELIRLEIIKQHPQPIQNIQ
jgi:WD40 repeat protein/Tfp pilus assembly protein PilF